MTVPVSDAGKPTGRVGEYWWHVHHGDGLLFESLAEPAVNRREFVRKHKPRKEVETRLQLFQPVRGDLRPPEDWMKNDVKRSEANEKFKEAAAKRQEADAEWCEADAKWKEADAKWKEACAKWNEACAKWKEADAEWREADVKWKVADAKWKASADWARVEALHREECPDCPWNGETIFP